MFFPDQTKSKGKQSNRSLWSIDSFSLGKYVIGLFWMRQACALNPHTVSTRHEPRPNQQLYICYVFSLKQSFLGTLWGRRSAHVSLLRKKKIPEKIIMDCLHGWLCYNTFSCGTKRGHCSWIWYKLLLRSRGVGINSLTETAWLCLCVSLLIFFFF